MASCHTKHNGGAEYGLDRMSNGVLISTRFARNRVCDSLFQPTTQTNMFDSYEESVRFHADAEGKLPADVIKQLFQEHSSNFANYSSTVSDEEWDDANRVLDWLGY